MIPKLKTEGRWKIKIKTEMKDLLKTIGGVSLGLFTLASLLQPNTPGALAIYYSNGKGGAGDQIDLPVKQEGLMAPTLTIPLRRTQSFLNSDFSWNGGRNPYPAGHHEGIDFSCKTGDPLSTIIGGQVVFAKMTSVGYGNMVVVQNDDTQVRYGHLSKFAVANTNVVDATTKIGECGSTGFSTASHLHLEIRHKGLPVDIDYAQQWETYKNAGVQSCKDFMGNKQHFVTKEFMRDQCEVLFEQTSKENVDYFDMIGILQAEAGSCTNPRSKVFNDSNPDNDRNCLNWGISNLTNFGDIPNCKTWENCFGIAVRGLKKYELEHKLFTIYEKMQRYAPPAENNTRQHAANINAAKKQLFKSYKNYLKI